MNNEKYIELFNEILNCEDFELVRYKNGDFALHDIQGANLGGIEEETFENMVQVLDRMEVYHIGRVCLISNLQQGVPCENYCKFYYIFV